MRRQTNQHFDLFDRRKSLRTNAVTPNVIFGPIWLHDDQQSSMEIIELNSSNEVERSPRETKERNRSNNNINHAWSYVNNDDIEQIEDSYKINKQARERRRLENENNFSMIPATYASTDAIDFNRDSTHNFYPNQSNNNINEELRFNHQTDRLTIINKHFIESDTSTEEDYGDVDIMTSDDLVINRADWEPRENNFYNEEIITYDTDLDQETRTIWIYSYKNKHLLSEDNFETVNIPSKEMSSSSTSYSSDSSSEHPKERSTPSCRIGSPIPTYIPKLDLSLVPTLSTVTEMTERNIHTTTPNESSASFKEKDKKPCNNWFISESAKLPGVKSARKHEKSTNIINWMALSPREKRRVLVDKSFTDRWVESRLNLADISADNLDNHGDRPNDALQNEGVKVIVDVVVHVDVNEKSENTTVEELKSAGALLRSNIDEIPTIHQIKYADATCEEFQDRGDHYTNLVVAPAIRLSPRNFKRFEITDPIEKLENSNWIRQTKEEKETAVYDYVLDKSESISDDKNADNTVDQVWMKNTIPFLKPSEWNAFLPITETPVSYHLSLGSIIEERKTWYKRLMNFFNCCK